MPKQQGKAAPGIRLGIGLILTILIAVLIYAFLLNNNPIKENDFVFDGWLYNREDQKRATTALAKAGLFDYHWESGRLSVPKSEKAKYESALTENAAFPKAPSDIQWESLKEMGQFEPESKSRARELLSCAKQLEQTFEYYEKQIQYATVGVRLRREQTGLIVKNITTASIGICMQENATLTPELLSAITIAAKHQLGISNNKDISILDFRAGRAYLGTEEAVSNAESASLIQEQKRQELYWQEKFQNALSFIPEIYISTTVDLEPITHSETNELNRTLILAQADENGQIVQQSIAYIGFPNFQNESGNKNGSLSSFEYRQNNQNKSEKNDSSTSNAASSQTSLNQTVVSTDSSENQEVLDQTIQTNQAVENSNNQSNLEMVSAQDNSSLNFQNGEEIASQNISAKSTLTPQTSNASLIHLNPIKQRFMNQPISEPLPKSFGKLRGVSVSISIPESYIEQLAIKEMKRSSSEKNKEQTPADKISNATFTFANNPLEQVNHSESQEKNLRTNPSNQPDVDSKSSSETLNDFRQTNNDPSQNSENSLTEKQHQDSETNSIIASENNSKHQPVSPNIPSELFLNTKNNIIQNVHKLVLTLLKPVLKGEGIDLSNSDDWIRISFYSDNINTEPHLDDSVKITTSKPIIPFGEITQIISHWRIKYIGILIPGSLILGACLLALIQFSLRRRKMRKNQNDSSHSTQLEQPDKTFAAENDHFLKNAEKKHSNFYGNESVQSHSSLSLLDEPDQFYRLDSSEEDLKANILNDLYKENEEKKIEDELELNSHLRNDSYDLMQKEVKDLIANHPEQAAQIIRRWIRTGT
ncbi:MAG: hypothetical protein Q4C95_00035 [Planctomycetia bacterium]|nr:hypothetical protein [Planctomycetia bacterium]